MTGKLIQLLFKLRSEGRALDVVNGLAKAILPVNRHARTSGSQMGMIIRPEKQIKRTVFL
jgi:hypothetical protein